MIQRSLLHYQRGILTACIQCAVTKNITTMRVINRFSVMPLTHGALSTKHEQNIEICSEIKH